MIANLDGWKSHLFIPRLFACETASWYIDPPAAHLRIYSACYLEHQADNTLTSSLVEYEIMSGNGWWSVTEQLEYSGEMGPSRMDFELCVCHSYFHCLLVSSILIPVTKWIHLGLWYGFDLAWNGLDTVVRWSRLTWILKYICYFLILLTMLSMYRYTQ